MWFVWTKRVVVGWILVDWLSFGLIDKVRVNPHVWKGLPTAIKIMNWLIGYPSKSSSTLSDLFFFQSTRKFLCLFFFDRALFLFSRIKKEILDLWWLPQVTEQKQVFKDSRTERFTCRHTSNESNAYQTLLFYFIDTRFLRK